MSYHAVSGVNTRKSQLIRVGERRAAANSQNDQRQEKRGCS